MAYLECEVVHRQVFGDHMVLVGRAIHSAINRPARALVYNYQDYQ
jgi:flavin reductase (DIM6/NTAB) family NADH-FMN oxidoreductase RutF